VVTLADPGLPVGVVGGEDINDMMRAGAGESRVAVDGEGAGVVLHDRVEIIRSIVVEASRDVEVVGVVGLDVAVIDGDVRTAIGAGLRVVEGQAWPSSWAMTKVLFQL